MADWVVIITRRAEAGEHGTTWSGPLMPIVMLVPETDDELSATLSVLGKYPNLDVERVRVWAVPYRNVTEVEVTREYVVRAKEKIR